MQFSCFSVLPGSTEAQVIWGGVVKCLLIACFIGNIFAKKHQNPFTRVRVIASQRWDVFWDTVYKFCHAIALCAPRSQQYRDEDATKTDVNSCLVLQLAITRMSRTSAANSQRKEHKLYAILGVSAYISVYTKYRTRSNTKPVNY